jgi:hypothetical protein
MIMKIKFQTTNRQIINRLRLLQDLTARLARRRENPEAAATQDNPGPGNVSPMEEDPGADYRRSVEG